MLDDLRQTEPREVSQNARPASGPQVPLNAGSVGRSG